MFVKTCEVPHMEHSFLCAHVQKFKQNICLILMCTSSYDIFVFISEYSEADGEFIL